MNVRYLACAIAIVAAVAPRAWSGESAADVRSLRPVPIEATTKAEPVRNLPDRAPYTRDFVQQPPLIPHKVDGYTITANFNKCMDCHSWSRARQSGATKVSLTHFRDRDGRELSNVSPRRYFCMQCHVPQMDAAPLVKNTFEPVEPLLQSGK